MHSLSVIQGIGIAVEDRLCRAGIKSCSELAKPDWGVKRVCQSCAAKCYGLISSPIACPQCGTRFDPEAALKS